MQRIFTVVSILLLLSILLTSCGQSPATPTLASTATARPTRTLTPTSTNSPIPTATTTLSPVEKIFAIPTRQNDLPNTPTAIDTPILDINSMQIKEPSEKDALHFIDEMNMYSYQNYPSHNDWWTDGEFIASQEPVGLVIQEFLYRFPNSSSAERLRWQLAFIDSINGGLGGNEYDEPWMIQELQKSLNRGEVPPDNLERNLDKYWFEVNYVQAIENLFGDGKTAWFYMIGPQVWADEEENKKSPDYFLYGGLFIVVHKVKDDQFQVLLLKNAMIFSFDESSVFNISDYNQNGRPEIALYVGGHSGTMCSGNLLIYEWMEDGFAELTNGKIKVGDCSDNFEYSLDNGTPSIINRRIMGGGTSIYTWNGSSYLFSGYKVTTPIERWSFAQSPSEEAQAIEAILISSDKEGLNSSRVDFLRYRLGIAYALNSEPAQVKRVLQDLADNPLDKTRTIYSDLAKNFLRYYSGDKTLYLACKKAREALNKVWGSLSGEEEDELFGYPFDFTFGRGLLRCFDHDVLETLVKNIPTEAGNIAEVMQGNGMNLYYAKKTDVNLDGLAEDWIFLIQDGLYIVYPDKSGYTVKQLEYFWGAEPSQYSKIDFNIDKWNGITNPVLTAITPDELLIFDIGKDFTPTALSSEFAVDDIILSPQNDPAQFQVFHKKPGPDEDFYSRPWSGYRWDVRDHEFKEDLLEYTLFVERNPDEAVNLVKAVLPILNKWKSLDSARYWLPRYMYLCGLTYELSGDEQRAADIYWQLWHDFPESHYARLAEFKLEPMNP